MTRLIDNIQGERVDCARPGRALRSTRRAGARRGELAAAGPRCRPLGRAGARDRAHGDHRRRPANRGRQPPLPDETFPSVGALHPPAIRLERAIYESLRLRAGRTRRMRGPGSISASGTSGIRSAPRAGAGRAPPTRSCRSEGESAAPDSRRPGARRHHRARTFPLHRRGETVVRLEERLGYVHKGIESLMAGATIEQAARLAARDLRRQHRRLWARLRACGRGGARHRSRRRARAMLRALMAELERLANHFGDIGAICNDASFSLMHGALRHLARLVLRAASACFGHRLMMDRVVPGGVAADLAPEWRDRSPSCFVNRGAISAADRALRQHRLAAGPHRRRPAS